MSSELLKNLNKEQEKAVTHNDGPLLIVAGAGTGKTTVVTKRIAYIIEQCWAKPEEILALTFTEKAAQEMEERVDKLLPFGYVDLWISTFHSFGERILREYAIEIGLPGNFKLLNEYEQWALVRKNLDLFSLDYYKPLGNPTKFIHDLVKHFSRLKDEDITADEYLQHADSLDKSSITNYELRNNEEELEIKKIVEVAGAYKVYQQLLLDNNSLDFGDLINYCLKLFRERPNILARYKAQFKYILVDEFQDTNLAQYQLIKLLTDDKSNLVVVGDDDQCLPGDSLVLTKNGERKISEIKKGELVASAVGKGYLSYSEVQKVGKTRKEAKLLSFTLKNGASVSVTNNHKMFCFVQAENPEHFKVKNKDTKYFYVYLMHKQELGWRIGMTGGLSQRLRLERSADRIVAVQAFTTEEEARYVETFLSLKYGIPTVCFQTRDGIMDQKKWSEKLYQDLDVQMAIENLANDLDLDLNAHQVCLDAVNRGSKTRIKINLEMCHRNYRSKYAQGVYLDNPRVEHLLSLETSYKETIKKLTEAGFTLSKSKKGKRLRISSADLFYLGELALKIQRITGGIIENKIKVGKTNIAHKKALVIPASNVLEGMYLPVVTKRGIIYEQIIKREETVRKIFVYDLEVARSHNFVANSIVVHNSIYKFRGGSVSNILQFKNDYPTAQELVLTNNYRNKQNILDLAYDFIQLNNPNRLEYQLQQQGNKSLSKKLKSNTGTEGAVELIEGFDLEDEMRLVVEKISDLKLQDAETNWGDFGILVRANDSANEVCAALEEADLPYVFYASRGLYNKPVIMDVVAYLRMLDNYHESIHLYRVLNFPMFQFAHKELVDLNHLANKKSWSLFEALRQAAQLKLGAIFQQKAAAVLAHIERHTQLVNNKTVRELVVIFLNELGYLQHLLRLSERQSREQIAYLNKFLKRLIAFEAANDDKSVRNFLSEFRMELESGEQGSVTPDEEAGPETIKVMTVHASKGLEFKYVFLVGMVDKRFPTIERRDKILIPEALIKENLPEGDHHIEEERRLFYVAATRAKNGLYLSWAKNYGGAREKKPSRFLMESSLLKENQEKTQKQKTQDTNIDENKLLRPYQVNNKKAKDESLIDYIPPKHYSFTQLVAFESCPYQYRFAHILKIPRQGKGVFSFGRTMHSTLQKLFELVAEKRGLGQQDLFAKPKTGQENISWDEVVKIYEESWLDDWYEDAAQKEKYFTKGKEILKTFYAKHKDNWPQIKHLEKGFNIKLKDEQNVYTVRGVVDRVDAVDGKVRIVDYKTGTPKEKLTFEDKAQLFIYQIAAEEIFGYQVASLEFYYLDNNSEMEFLGTDKEIEKLKVKIVENIKEINKGKFPPKPSILCKYCDFNDICEFRKL